MQGPLTNGNLCWNIIFAHVLCSHIMLLRGGEHAEKTYSLPVAICVHVHGEDYVSHSIVVLYY